MRPAKPSKQFMLQIWSSVILDSAKQIDALANGELTESAAKAAADQLYPLMSVLWEAQKRLRRGTRRGTPRPGTECPKCHIKRQCGFYEGRCMPGGKLYCRCEGRTPPCPGCVACSDLKPPEVPAP